MFPEQGKHRFDRLVRREILVKDLLFGIAFLLKPVILPDIYNPTIGL